jgi:hypothetical protein
MRKRLQINYSVNFQKEDQLRRVQSIVPLFLSEEQYVPFSFLSITITTKSLGVAVRLRHLHSGTAR